MRGIFSPLPYPNLGADNSLTFLDEDAYCTSVGVMSEVLGGSSKGRFGDVP